MKRVSQTKRGWEGNCTAACLASIFEAPIESIPELSEYGRRGDADGMFDAINAWLIERYGVVMVQATPDVQCPAGYWIATTEVAGRKDFTHATVWYRDKLVWNPTPGASQSADELGDLVAVNLFVLVDPAILYSRGWLAAGGPA